MADSQIDLSSQAKEERDRSLQSILHSLQQLESIGDETKREAQRLGQQISELFSTPAPRDIDQLPALKTVATIFKREFEAGWGDRRVAQILFQFGEYLKRKDRALVYVAENVETWLESHPDDAVKVLLCLDVVPPPGISIVRVLNNGAQKQVYVARWPEITPRELAFKVLTDPDGDEGDSFPHPLRGHHPNIIETFVLQSAADDQVFLVESLLQTTLSDLWDPRGLGEIVNLIRDIAHALSFVHGYGRIHGDIKLDNIGFESSRYILLDFGLCRKEPIEGRVWTPTGNVRGLAPELLIDELSNSRASDVWALGSVAYAALTGRPPYFKKQEKQHGFNPVERSRVVKKLAARVKDPAWLAGVDKRLRAGAPEYRLRSIVEQMLAVDPPARPTAQQVFERCNGELGEFLRPVERTVELTPAEELKNMLYLRKEGEEQLASESTRLAVANATKRIDRDSLKPFEQAQLSDLVAAH